MKQIVLLLSLLLFIQSSFAQGLSVGARTGIGVQLEKYDWQYLETTTWNSQLAIRYEAKRHFAYELNVEHDYHSFKHIPGQQIYFESQFAPPLETENERLVKQNRIGLNIAVQYGFGFKQSDCKLFKRIRTYFGLQICPSKTIYNEQSDYISLEDSSISTRRSSYSYFDISVGINNTLKYQLTERVNIVTNLSLRANPWELTDTYDRQNRLYAANSSLAFTFGFLYKL